MILAIINNGGWYEDDEDWPAVLCENLVKAQAAQAEFNAWCKRLQAFFTKTACNERDYYQAMDMYSKRKAWLRDNPPPFWAAGHSIEYSNDLIGLSVDLQEVPLYTPKDFT